MRGTHVERIPQLHYLGPHETRRCCPSYAADDQVGPLQARVDHRKNRDDDQNERNGIEERDYPRDQRIRPLVVVVACQAP